MAAVEGKLLGVFDHFYEDNVFAIPGFGTHYVALGFQLTVSSAAVVMQDSQHAELKWWTVDSLLSSNAVHSNTKLYFADDFLDRLS